MTWVAGCGADGFAIERVDEVASHSQELNLEWMEEGIGVDVIRDEFRGKCVDFDGVRQVSKAEGGTETLLFEVAESSHQLASKLGVSAAASASFAVGSIDTKMQYVNSRVASASSVYLVARVTVHAAPWIIKNPRLKPNFYELLRKNPDEFRSKCGDGFVSGYKTGGEYSVVVEVMSENKDDRRDLLVALKGHAFSGSGGFELNRTTVSEIRKRRFHLWSEQKGGNVGLLKPAMSIEEIPEKIKALSSIVESGGGERLGLSVHKYNEIADDLVTINVTSAEDALQALVDTKRDNMDAISCIGSMDELPSGVTEYYTENKSKITHAYRAELGTYGVFGEFRRIDFLHIGARLRENIALLDSALRACRGDIKQCKMPALHRVESDEYFDSLIPKYLRVLVPSGNEWVQISLTPLKKACRAFNQ